MNNFMLKYEFRFPNENIIMGGYFNCLLSENNKEGGRDISLKKKCKRRDPKFDSSSKFGGRVEIATSKGKRFHLANPRFKNKMKIGVLVDNKRIFAKVPCATLRH